MKELKPVEELSHMEMIREFKSYTKYASFKYLYQSDAIRLAKIVDRLLDEKVEETGEVSKEKPRIKELEIVKTRILLIRWYNGAEDGTESKTKKLKAGGKI